MENIRQAVWLCLVSFSLVFPSMLLGQGMEGCSMCGVMGWAGMVLGGLLAIALIAALVALAIFLIRRSRSSH